jgi:hypothetical protein
MHADFLRRLITWTSITAAFVSASFFVSSAQADASAAKNVAFCTAELYISHTAFGGLIAPFQWRSVAQEKATLKRVDDDLARAATDAPTKAFASLAREIVGTFSGWIDDPKLLSQEANSPSPKGGSFRFSMSSRLVARMATMGDVTASGDYVWPVYAACPDMEKNAKSGRSFGESPPKYRATPIEVAAILEASGAMIGSRLTSTKAFDRPTMASMRAAVTRIDSKYPSRDIVVIGVPTLLNGVWRAEYRVTASHERFDVFVSELDSSSATDITNWPRVSDVVPVTS